jgi:hypothetical protein
MRKLIWLLCLLFVTAARITRAADSQPQQLWLYCANNLSVEARVADTETLWRRAAKLGYTHVLLSDSKFGKLGEMGANYFRNIEHLKKVAAELNLEIVPALFPIGYSNDILWNDPNLVEGLPVQDVPLVIQNGKAILAPGGQPLLKGGSLSDLKEWSWHDPNVVVESGAAVIRNPNGANARLAQKIKLTPFRQYHLTVRIKTKDFHGTPEVKILAGDRALDYNSLGVKSTQDWTLHHVVFDSLDHSEANLYLGCWGGGTGELWYGDVTLEQVAFVNLIRRQGAPFSIKNSDGQVLKEGVDFEPISDPKMGNRLWKGSYDVWHQPPALVTKGLADGTRLSASYYYAVTVNDDQAMICPSERKTVELLTDQAERMHKTWHAKGYMMSHDEIRVLNWCDACQKRHLTAGQILADNARTCVNILKEINPGGRIYVWSDMFDPFHNAHDNYYLVRDTLADSWEGLSNDVIIVPWYFEARDKSLKWFSDLGHHQVIAGYYDHDPAQIKQWLNSAAKVSGVEGVMYTTWESNFRDIESFAQFAGFSKR